jgi:hypothetical protein
MKSRSDWKAIAEAQGIFRLDVQDIVGRMEALEQIFRPAAVRLTFDQEPAAVFRADPEYE